MQHFMGLKMQGFDVMQCHVKFNLYANFMCMGSHRVSCGSHWLMSPWAHNCMDFHRPPHRLAQNVAAVLAGQLLCDC